MKTILIVIASIVSSPAIAQTLTDILSPKQMTITWLGVDFAHGKYKFAGDKPMQPKYLPDYCLRINKAIAEDHHKYYFPIAYRKDFQYNTSAMDKLNSSIGASAIATKTKEFPNFDPEKIKAIISSYEFPPELTGIGLVYVYENLMQSGNDKGSIWMAFIRIETKEILFLQNTTSGVQGKNIEEVWAYPVLSMLRKSKADMDKWALAPEKYNLLIK